MNVDDADNRASYAAFVEALQRLGWTDGRNVQIETRWPGSRASDLRSDATDLVALAPGVLVAAGAANRELIIALAAKYKLPAVYYRRRFVASGGLMSYDFDILEQYRGAAGYVDRILKGEKPADLPVQAPTKYVLTINLKTAKALLALTCHRHCSPAPTR
jgi:hypothetical protein